MSATSIALLRACSLLLFFVAGSLQLTIKEFHVPKAVEVGNKAELRCRYDLEADETDDALFVKWWWSPQSSSSWQGRKLIYQRITGHKPESVHHNNQTSHIDIHVNDTIVLLNVQPVDSGTYECEVSNIDEIRQHETLNVFTMGTGPKINYTLVKSSEDNEEKNMLLIECEAENVAPLPDMAITLQGEILNVSKTVQDLDGDGLYEIYANATVSTTNIEKAEIRCELSYVTLEMEQLPYVDIVTYVLPGSDAPPTTDQPDDVAGQDATPESLQNSSDGGIQFYCSWALLTFAAVMTQLHSTP